MNVKEPDRSSKFEIGDTVEAQCLPEDENTNYYGSWWVGSIIANDEDDYYTVVWAEDDKEDRVLASNVMWVSSRGPQPISSFKKGMEVLARRIKGRHGFWYSAHVVSVGKTKVRVSWFEFSDWPDKTLDLGDVRLLSTKPAPTNSKKIFSAKTKTAPEEVNEIPSPPLDKQVESPSSSVGSLQSPSYAELSSSSQASTASNTQPESDSLPNDTPHSDSLDSSEPYVKSESQSSVPSSEAPNNDDFEILDLNSPYEDPESDSPHSDALSSPSSEPPTSSSPENTPQSDSPNITTTEQPQQPQQQTSQQPQYYIPIRHPARRATGNPLILTPRPSSTTHTTHPTTPPTTHPTTQPVTHPTTRPITPPTTHPTTQPTTQPTTHPTTHPTSSPKSKQSRTVDSKLPVYMPLLSNKPKQTKQRYITRYTTKQPTTTEEQTPTTTDEHPQPSTTEDTQDNSQTTEDIPPTTSEDTLDSQSTAPEENSSPTTTEEHTHTTSTEENTQPITTEELPQPTTPDETSQLSPPEVPQYTTEERQPPTEDTDEQLEDYESDDVRETLQRKRKKRNSAENDLNGKRVAIKQEHENIVPGVKEEWYD